MLPIDEIASKLGLEKQDYTCYGDHVAKINIGTLPDRRIQKTKSHLINVTAITPSMKGVGKTTVTIGLLDALSKLNVKTTAAIRQSSLGPTFNLKGSGIGGGKSRCLPRDLLTLGLTGDMDRVTHAQNLAMVAASARYIHEEHDTNEQLQKKGLKRLSLDWSSLSQNWAIDLCAQSLRQIDSEINGVLKLRSNFVMTAASEVMSILTLSKDLKDLRKKIGQMVIAKSSNTKSTNQNKWITTEDLNVAGAMSALLINAFKPNLVQTLEGNPILIHSGPFANISIGQSSVIADRIGLSLCDYHITESGFGADIGYEKFWNIKCRQANMHPSAVVLVATIDTIKAHANCDISQEKHKIRSGFANLLHHINIIKLSNINPIVCINIHEHDSDKDVLLLQKLCKENSTTAVASRHFTNGSEGALELAEAVLKEVKTIKEKPFKYLYPTNLGIKEKVLIIAQKIYGANKVCFSDQAERQLQANCNFAIDDYNLCIAKTPYSLTHNPHLGALPQPFTLDVNNLIFHHGAQIAIPVCGDLKLMPGTGSLPSFRKIDIDPIAGDIIGL